MGFFDKKSYVTTAANNLNLGFSEVSGDAVGIVGDNNITTDHGAISGALAFGESALDFGGDALDSTVGLAREVIRSSGEQSAKLYQGYGQQLESFASKATADQGDKLAEITKWMIGGLVIIAGASYLMKGRA